MRNVSFTFPMGLHHQHLIRFVHFPIGLHHLSLPGNNRILCSKSVTISCNGLVRSIQFGSAIFSLVQHISIWLKHYQYFVQHLVQKICCSLKIRGLEKLEQAKQSNAQGFHHFPYDFHHANNAHMLVEGGGATDTPRPPPGGSTIVLHLD